MTSDKTKARETFRLASGARLPDLHVVSIEQAFLHEDADPLRVARLSERLRKEGILRNPPVVAGLPDGAYVVLDGANRVSALAKVGARAIVVQVVDYDEPDVRLDVWRHFLLDSGDLPNRLAGQGLPVRPMAFGEADRLLSAGQVACYLVTASGVHAVSSAQDRPLPATLSQVVNTYKGSARIYRVLTADVQALADEYGAPGTVVVFPRFDKADILEIARSPVKLPTGITRHLITGRTLRLDVPLDLLTSASPIEEKDRWLTETIHQKLLDNRIRYYPEASFLFDE